MGAGTPFQKLVMMALMSNPLVKFPEFTAGYLWQLGQNTVDRLAILISVSG